jgi:hypothetical protein
MNVSLALFERKKERKKERKNERMKEKTKERKGFNADFKNL